MVLKIESFIKQDSGAKQGSAIEKVRDFLATGELEAAVVAVVGEKGVVN